VRFTSKGEVLFNFNFTYPSEDLFKGLLKGRLRFARLAELFY